MKKILLATCALAVLAGCGGRTDQTGATDKPQKYTFANQAAYASAHTANIARSTTHKVRGSISVARAARLAYHTAN